MTTKELAKLVDRRYKLRARRYAAQHRIEAWKAQEAQMDATLLAELAANGTTQIGGTVAWCERQVKAVPRVTDWPALYTHILASGSFDLLHRRVSDVAVRERWNAHDEIPGVTAENVAVLSLHGVTP